MYKFIVGDRIHIYLVDQINTLSGVGVVRERFLRHPLRPRRNGQEGACALG
jgi:hypothetical protein